MHVVRNSVFETNSSSTHSICITCNRRAALSHPKKLHFACDITDGNGENLSRRKKKRPISMQASSLCMEEIKCLICSIRLQICFG